MKAGYKSKKKASKDAKKKKKAADEGVLPADEGDDVEMQDTEDTKVKRSARAQRKLAMKKQKEVRLKTGKLKKNKRAIRAELIKGIEGATNTTRNQLSQNALKLAQERTVASAPAAVSTDVVMAE